MKRRVTFLTNGMYPCITGGLEIFHYNFIKELSKKVPVYALTLCDQSFEGENITTCKTKSPIGRLQTLFTVFYHTKWLFKYRKSIDVIYIPYASQLLFQYYHAIIFARLFGIPYVLRISAGKMGAAHPDFLHALMFKYAGARIAVSAPLKEEYERRYHYNVEVLPSYLPFLKTEKTRNEIRENLNIETDSFVILFLGTVKKIKGPEVLVDAVCSFGIEYLEDKNIQVLFVGGNDHAQNGDMISILEKRSKEGGVLNHVRFSGSVPYEDVHKYYLASDVFIIPSIFEARPLALAEALYNGIPAIGSDIATISNTIRNGENGYIFQQGNSEDLATKIRQLVDHPDTLKEFSKICKKERSVYDNFNAMVDRYVEIFQKVCNK